jgi:signal transduction histidine kinase
MIWDWLRRRPRSVDVALVALLLLVTLGAGGRRHDGGAALALGVAETLPLLVRRRRPLAVAAVVTGAVLALIALDAWFLPLQLAVALYTLAATRPRGAGRLAGAASIVAVAVALGLGGDFEFANASAHVVFLVAAWLLGDSIGSRRAYVEEIEEKAARLERERQTEARRAAAEEQARIARELHDVVAHALSVIIVQAGAADDVFEREPARAREPIRAIDAAARAALADLRRVLGILQRDAEYEPQPGLGRLDELVERVRATGLDVALEIHGAARPLPAAVDLSAYRIVQEALTNTLKHARAEHVRVRVRYGEELGLEIRDDGAAAGNGGNGNGGSGLIGMRERVALLGGRIDAGSAPGGGYLVSATIPIEGAG